jgi:DegV family protein with EDD domain
MGGSVPVKVITDSASSLPADERDRLGVRVVPLYVTRESGSIPESDLDIPAFYETVFAEGAMPGTSQPAPEDFGLVFEEAAAAGHETLAVLISSKMSSTLRSAEIGASVRERHPGARIAFVDSMSNSMQEGFAVMAAAECAAEGGDLDTCATAARRSIARSRFLFAPKSLDQLARGGRIAGATALLGGMLRIVPILTAANGTTGVAGVVRTRTGAMKWMASAMARDVGRNGLKRCAVQFIANEADAARFALDYIEPIAGAAVALVPVPPVVGIHVGPAIGVAYETVEALR